MTDQPDQDVLEAITRCKEFQANRPGTPICFYLVICDEHMVLMPPTIEANDRLTRMTNSKEKQDVLTWISTYFAEHIFWIRGQTGEGRTAALQHATKVRNSEWTKADLFALTVKHLEECLELHKAETAKERPSAKKF